MESSSLDIIGIDLSSSGSYNQEARFGYKVKAGRWMCGNKGDLPGVAGKLMERLNNA
jgi:hypothetical protein